MASDFSRNTFTPKKHNSGVLMQQGRVKLDNDLNEELSIAEWKRYCNRRAVTTTISTMLLVSGCCLAGYGLYRVIQRYKQSRRIKASLKY